MYVDHFIVAEPVAIKAWSAGRYTYIVLANGRTLGFPADRFPFFQKQVMRN